MLTQSDVERNLYELRSKSELDIVSALRYAHDEGVKQVRVEQIQRFQCWLKQAPAAPEVLTPKTLEELELLAEQLARQVEQRLAGAQ